MQSAPLPPDEAARLRALHQLDVLDSGPEEEFDALIKIASLVCGVPISLISLVDTQRQWFKANIGLPGVTETPRDIAFCAHAILDDGVFEVSDATQDARFFDNPIVLSQPDIRFYAGAPIVLSGGERVGTLCVIDRQPQTLNDKQREILQCLAVAAAQALEGRKAMRALSHTAQTLQKTHALLDRTGRLAGVGGWEVDLATERIYWSDETCRIHGVEPGYAPSMEQAIAFYAPQARQVIGAAVRAAMGGAAAWDLELPLIKPGGEPIWVRAVGAAEFEGDKPVRLVGAFQDITVQRGAQDALRETQERVTLATDSGGIGIWDMDLVTGELLWDAQSYRLHGLEPSDKTQAYALWERHLHPEDKASAELAFEHALVSGKDFECEFRVVWSDGSIHHIKGYGRLRLDPQGKPVRMVGTNIDVTAAAHYAQSLQLARQQAELASQSKGQFLANMSHEIRTPMNAILGLLNLLQATELTARQLDYLSKTEGAAKSLLGLLNDILDFSKVEAGKMTLEREPFRLDKLLRDLSVVLSANVGSKPVEVLFDVDDTLPEVLLGDALRLKQVLINLGGNAVKFTAQGQVVLGLRNLGQREGAVAIGFTVQDSGIGIAPEHQADIFTGFSQAEASTTRRFGGSGLGLAICKRLVEMMGGDIAIESALGVGSTFSFYLELPVAQALPAELAMAAPPKLTPQRVLLVDDNPVAGKLMLRMVHSLGWTADWAHSGAQALDRVHAELACAGGLGKAAFPYSLVLVDWQMSGMDGWETTSHLRHICQQCPGVQPQVIMVTARGHETLSQRSVQEQSMLNGFLVKPLTAPMLLQALSDAADGRTDMQAIARGRSGARQLVGMRILVVEDNLLNQQVAEELLSAQGAIVSMAANGKLGVEAVAAAAPQFDVVLMDIQMPVMDGYIATRAIREQLGLVQLPIVAMTANAMASDRDACIAGGMNEHVGKPFDMAQLVSLLIRVSGFQALPNSAANGAAVLAHSAELAVPGLQLRVALARMSGLNALYARTARDFAKALHTQVDELGMLLQAGEQKKAVMLLHTLKGNAGTLGAPALAQLAGSLEALCTTETGPAQCVAQLDALRGVAASTRSALLQAVVLLEPTSQQETSANSSAVDTVVAIAALQELGALLADGDMAALQRYAELRSTLEGLPVGFFDAFDNAMQDLEFTQAQGLCMGMLQQLLS